MCLVCGLEKYHVLKTVFCHFVVFVISGYNIFGTILGSLYNFVLVEFPLKCLLQSFLTTVRETLVASSILQWPRRSELTWPGRPFSRSLYNFVLVNMWTDGRTDGRTPPTNIIIHFKSWFLTWINKSVGSIP